MKSKKRLSEVILLIAILGVTYLLIVLDPSGNLFENIMSKASYLVLGLFIILLIAGGLVFLLFIFQSFRTWGADAKHPNFFEEIQSLLRTELIPLGFEESKGPMGRMKDVEYTQGNLSVKLSLDIMDSLYYLSARSDKEKGSYFTDFSLEGHISEADKFKSDSMARLNGWLSRNGLK
jgi:hypothetical protein